MIALTICNHKGGTGKTTTVIHTAAALGLTGYRVLVVDLDPQGFLSRMLGAPEPAEEASTLMLFDHETPLRDVPVTSLKSFDLLPSSTSMTRIMRRLNKPTDVLWTKEALEAGLDYDIILFDTAAAVTVFSLNALVASQHVLIPVTPEYQPVLGAEQTNQTALMVQQRLNPDLKTPHFLFTQVDARKRSHYRYRSYLRKRYGDQVMDGIIRTSTALSISHGNGTTVFEHDPYSRGARDYANTTDELIRRIAPDKTAAQPVAEAPGAEAPQATPVTAAPTAPPTVRTDEAPPQGQPEALAREAQPPSGEAPPMKRWQAIQHFES